MSFCGRDRTGRRDAKKISVRGIRPAGPRSIRSAEGQFDQITLSAPAGQAEPTFRELAASLSHQVRTFNTTGRIQDLRRQVASGEYRPDARETAARMLLMTEGE